MNCKLPSGRVTEVNTTKPNEPARRTYNDRISRRLLIIEIIQLEPHPAKRRGFHVGISWLLRISHRQFHGAIARSLTRFPLRGSDKPYCSSLLQKDEQMYLNDLVKNACINT